MLCCGLFIRLNLGYFMEEMINSISLIFDVNV